MSAVFIIEPSELQFIVTAAVTLTMATDVRLSPSISVNCKSITPCVMDTIADSLTLLLWVLYIVLPLGGYDHTNTLENV